jgi:hypothetical protein
MADVMTDRPRSIDPYRPSSGRRKISSARPLRWQAGVVERAGGWLVVLAKPRNAQEQESKKFPTKFVMPVGLAARLGKDWDFIDKDDKACRHRLGEFKESETPAPVGPSLPTFLSWP